MTKLKIVTGAKTDILRKKTVPVPKVTKEILKLLKDMEETVTDVGAGLAAPQIGSSHRVCLALVNGKFIPMINPKITWRGDELVTDIEGCLSLPGQDVPVSRAREIVVRYLDPKGNEQERRLEDWNARVVQHEVDHLDGILIVDYLRNTMTELKKNVIEL